MSRWFARVGKTLESLSFRVRLVRNSDEVRALVVRAHHAARALNGLEPVQESRPDPVTALESACLLLESAARRANAASPQPETVAREPIDAPLDEEPSTTARELIGLRDVVLLALAGADSGARDVLKGIYGRLGKVLEREGVSSVEELGAFDPAKHEVVDTWPTGDPTEDEVVCETIRPPATASAAG